MNSSDPKSTDRAKQILHRLAESSDSLEISGTKSNPAQLAKRLQQIEQLFLLHGGERKNHQGPAADQILFEWGHLQVIGSLGEGSFGEVYRAYDRILDREVALKLLKADQNRPFQSQLFLHEARQLALVRHRNVLAVHGAGIHDSRAGLWTDLIEGNTAHHETYRAYWSTLEPTLELIESMALALQAVHSAGLIHGDIKPSNIMRDQSGNWILMDFGASLDHRTSDQMPSMTSGTPLYMAPEVVLGAPATAESDLYSLGATLYRVLVGEPPVNANDWDSLKSQHKTGQPLASARRAATLDRRIAEIIDGLMSPSPANRTPLDRVLTHVQAIREAPQRRFRRIALGSIAGLLVLGLSLTSIGFYQANEARIVAEREQRNTNAVNEFLFHVLHAPSRSGRGRDMTVEDMLSTAAENVALSLEGQHEAQAIVHRVLAGSYNTLQIPDQAETHIQLGRDIIANENLDLPSVERKLALTEMIASANRDDDERTIELAEQFLEQHASEIGIDHVDARYARNFKMEAHLSLGQLDEAERLLVSHDTFIPEPETAANEQAYVTLRNRTSLYLAQGRFDEALAAAELALDWIERYPRAGANDYADALGNLSTALARTNQFDRAIEIAHRVIPYRERIDGVGSSEYVGALNQLAVFQREAGYSVESGQTLRRALDSISADSDAVSDRMRLIMMSNLANVLNETGEMAEGEAMIRETLSDAIERLGNDSELVLTLEYNLAEQLSLKGRFEEAVELAEGTLERKTSAFGPDHYLTLLTMDNLAVALAGLNRFEEALALHHDALSALADQLGPNHPFVLIIERHRMSTLLRGAPEQLEPDAVTNLIRRHEQALGPDHPDTEKARSLLSTSNR